MIFFNNLVAPFTYHFISIKKPTLQSISMKKQCLFQKQSGYISYYTYETIPPHHKNRSIFFHDYDCVNKFFPHHTQ